MPRLAAALSILLAAGPAFAQATHHVAVTFGGFNPERLVLAEGDTVVWHNVDGFHDIEETTDGIPAGFGRTAGVGWTYSFVFEDTGAYTYRCSLHHVMTGEVAARPAAAAVTVSRPVARQVVRPGEHVAVAWASRGLAPGSDVRVRLVRQGRPPVVLVASTPDDGAAVVAIPAGTAAGVNYQIEVAGPGPARAKTAGFSGPFTVSPTGQAEAVPAAGDHAAHGPALAVRPNPASRWAEVTLTLHAEGTVRLSLLDAVGREVVVLYDDPLPVGTRRFGLDGTRLPSGTYLVQMATAQGVRTHRVTLVK